MATYESEDTSGQDTPLDESSYRCRGAGSQRSPQTLRLADPSTFRRDVPCLGSGLLVKIASELALLPAHRDTEDQLVRLKNIATRVLAARRRSARNHPASLTAAQRDYDDYFGVSHLKMRSPEAAEALLLATLKLNLELGRLLDSDSGPSPIESDVLQLGLREIAALLQPTDHHEEQA